MRLLLLVIIAPILLLDTWAQVIACWVLLYLLGIVYYSFKP